MAHDVFISYSSRDKTVADAICAALEAKRIRCWIAPRDVEPGQEWAGAIATAIPQSKLFILVFSSGANSSSHIIREVTEAAGFEITIIPFRVDETEPTGTLRYYIRSLHWLDALTPPMEAHIETLSHNVKTYLESSRSVADDDTGNRPLSTSSAGTSKDINGTSPEHHKHPENETRNKELPDLEVKTAADMSLKSEEETGSISKEKRAWKPRMKKPLVSTTQQSVPRTGMRKWLWRVVVTIAVVGIIVLANNIRNIITESQNTLSGEIQPDLVETESTVTEPAASETKEFSVDLGNGVTMEMVWIPAGNFLIGSPTDKADRNNESPQTQVSVDGFWIGKYEVTQAQYEAIFGTNPSHFNGKNNPVDTINWYDAMEFCQELSKETGDIYTLPTEAQWEYACRAGTTADYCFGDSMNLLSDYAWFEGNSNFTTHAVGSKECNNWELYDMHGNVWEWCLSLHKPYPYNDSDGRNNLQDASCRVLRGGSYLRVAQLARCALRSCNNPNSRYDDGGFRCVKIP